MHVFRILGDPVRFRIVEILASGDAGVGELTDAVRPEFGISRAAVSHHLRVLLDNDFVTVTAEENRRRYRLHWNALESVDRVLLDLFEKWDQRRGLPYKLDPTARTSRRHRLSERAGEWRPVTQAEIEPLAPDDLDPFTWMLG